MMVYKVYLLLVHQNLKTVSTTRQISHMGPYWGNFLKMNVLNFKLLMSIQIGQFRGHGKLSANGGKGHSSGGGGAGGRIGIHARQNNEYGGQLLAYGETGTSSGDRGGPGTVFVEDKTGLFTYQSRLYIDGKNLEKPKPVIVIERNPRIVQSGDDIDNDADLNFDHLMLNNKVTEKKDGNNFIGIGVFCLFQHFSAIL